MQIAEKYTMPIDGQLYPSIKRWNALNEHFFVRPGKIRFQVWNGDMATNIKVILKVFRRDGICEYFILDTDYYDVQPYHHKRVTRNFFIHPFPLKLGQITCVKFSYVFHLGEQSICSQYDYLFMDRANINEDRFHWREITNQGVTPNTYQTVEVDASLLQRDVDWYNCHTEALNMIPKFSKGQCHHPYHPKRFIHDQINLLIRNKETSQGKGNVIKVCVDCIDDTDFINHLIFAHNNDITVQCIVDWRKMTLTNSENYVRLKQSGIELLGVFCSSNNTLIEVTPDMHNKFVIFGEEDCILGSFNITFDTWGGNWESGATFHSHGVCRLLDNIFQSIRGGVIQRYRVEPLSHFNLLYTFGRHKMMNGNNYRPHQAIISAIHNAKYSIRACLFLLGELQGDYGDSVVDALIKAKKRGVELAFIFNGHMARIGDPAQEYPMREELKRPLLPAIERLKRAGVPIALVYSTNDHAIPYSPLHTKYCIIDDHIVLDGSFNWYNTSVFSHDHLTVVANRQTARLYKQEFYEALNTLRVYWGEESVTRESHFLRSAI